MDRWHVGTGSEPVLLLSEPVLSKSGRCGTLFVSLASAAHNYVSFNFIVVRIFLFPAQPPSLLALLLSSLLPRLVLSLFAL